MQIRISQGFHLCIVLFLQQNINFMFCTFSASLDSFLKRFPPPVEVTFTSFLSNSSKLYHTFFLHFYCLIGNITAIWQTVCFYFFFPVFLSWRYTVGVTKRRSARHASVREFLLSLKAKCGNKIIYIQNFNDYWSQEPKEKITNQAASLFTSTLSILTFFQKLLVFYLL